MNDNENEAVSNDANSTSSLGQVLSAARKQQGLSEQQVADRLHLRVSSIRTMELDGVEKGVSLTFTKGYVRLYAKLLGLHAEPLLLEFDALHAQDTQPAKLQSFSKRVAREANDSRWNMVTYIIVFLVIGSVVVWWIDQSHFSFADSFDSSLQAPTEETTAADTESLVSPALNDGQYSGADFSGEDQSSLGSASLVTADDDEFEPSFEQNAIDENVAINSPLVTELEQAQSESQEENVAFSDGVVQSNDLSQLTDSSSQTNDIATGEAPPTLRAFDSLLSNEPYEVNADGTVNMIFTFSDDCWVSVKDAFDETIAIGVKEKGRVMRVSGIPPISIILGAPQVVQIDFGGQSVDMGSYDGSRSANFQLPLQGE